MSGKNETLVNIMITTFQNSNRPTSRSSSMAQRTDFRKGEDYTTSMAERVTRVRKSGVLIPGLSNLCV